MNTYKKMSLFLLYLLTVSYAQGSSSLSLQHSASEERLLAPDDTTTEQKICPSSAPRAQLYSDVSSEIRTLKIKLSEIEKKLNPPSVFQEERSCENLILRTQECLTEMCSPCRLSSRIMALACLVSYEKLKKIKAFLLGKNHEI